MYGLIVAVLIILLTIVFFSRKRKQTQANKPQSQFKDYDITNFKYNNSKIPPEE